MIFSKINQSIRIGLDKKSTVSVSDEVFKYIGTRSNTKVYQNIQGLTYSLDDILDDWEKNSVQMYIEFNSTGLVKSLGTSIHDGRRMLFMVQLPMTILPHILREINHIRILLSL